MMLPNSRLFLPILALLVAVLYSHHCGGYAEAGPKKPRVLFDTICVEGRQYDVFQGTDGMAKNLWVERAGECLPSDTWTEVG